MTTDFCLEAAREAIIQYGRPEIFNTDQGCQFTSQEFTGLLKDHGIQISMDGTGRWRDNVFVERLWRSLKYEEVSLHAYETVYDAHPGVARYVTFYHQIRPHPALDGRTPDRMYWENQPARPTAVGSNRPAPLMNRQKLSKQAEPPLRGVEVFKDTRKKPCL